MSRGPSEFNDWPESLTASFGPYRAIVRHHVDGDTYDVLLDLGWNDYRYHPVRLLGCDTPESNRLTTRAAGLAALEFVREQMPVGSRVLLHTEKDPDSFGRYLALITLEDGRDLTDLLLDSGHATAYPTSLR